MKKDLLMQQNLKCDVKTTNRDSKQSPYSPHPNTLHICKQNITVLGVEISVESIDSETGKTCSITTINNKHICGMDKNSYCKKTIASYFTENSQQLNIHHPFKGNVFVSNNHEVADQGVFSSRELRPVSIFDELNIEVLN